MKQYKKVFLAIAFMLLSLVSMSATYTWFPTAAGTYLWNDANNWRVGGLTGIPTSADVVNFTGISTVQSVTLPSTAFTVAGLVMTTTGAGAINFTASAAVTITITGAHTMTSSSIATTGTPGFGSNQFVTFVASGALTISNTKINYALKTNCANAAINGSTFSSAYELVATPTAHSYCGGNKFNGNFIVENKSTFALAMGATNPDTFNGTVTIKRTGTGDLHMSNNSVGNIYTKPITCYSTAAGGITFGNANGTSIFNGTSCLKSLATYMTAGSLYLKNITKTSTDSSSIVVDAGTVTVGPSMNITGVFTVTAYGVNMNGGANVGVATSNAFENNVDLTYTGQGNYSSLGGNLFKGTLKITNSGSTSPTNIVGFASTYNDQVNGNLTIVNTGALRAIILGTVKNFDLRGNAYVNNTNTGTIQLGDRTTTGVFLFATDKKTFIGFNGGVTNGYINFSSVNQAMPTDATSTGFLFDLKILNGTCATIMVGDLTIFRSRIEFEAPEILVTGGQFYNNTTLTVLDGCTVARAVTTPALPTLGSYIARHSRFYKDLTCNAKNTSQVNPTPAFFISADAAGTNETVLVDGNLILEQVTNNSRPITVATNASVKITVAGLLKVRHGGGNKHITVALNGQATVTGNIELSRGITGGTGLIYLGSEITTSLFTHNGTSVSIEPTKTFLGGGISFNYFKQTNSTGTITLLLPTPASNTTSVNLGYNSDFKSPVSVDATTVTIFQANFFQNVVLNSWSTGSYIKGIVNFTSDVSFTHNIPGTVNLIINSTAASNVTFNGNLALNANNATGLITSGSTASFTSITNVNKNLTYTNTSNAAVPTFFATTNFLGSIDQYMNYSPASITFQHVTINKPTGKLYVQKDVTITGNANFTTGIVVVPSSNVATFNSGSVVQSQGVTSYIDGKAQKIGNVAFTFPIGKNVFYAPIAISAPCNVAAAITADYLARYVYDVHPAGASGTLSPTLLDINIAGYWTVTCPNTYSCSIAVTLPWNTTSNLSINKSVMTVAKYIPTTWYDAGNVSSTGDAMTGSVTAATSTAFVGDYVLGYKTGIVLAFNNVSSSRFKMSGVNIDFIRNRSVSPPIDKIYGDEGNTFINTRLNGLAAQYAGYVIHPSINTTCAQIDILERLNNPVNGTYSALSLCLVTDASGNITNIKTTPAGQDLSTDLYTYNSTQRLLTIYGSPKSDVQFSITNNLYYGTMWWKLRNPTLSFTLNGNTFAYAYLKVTDVTGTITIFQGALPYTGTTLNWDGAGITTDGLYIYELSLGNMTDGTGAITYTGNLIVKLAQ